MKNPKVIETIVEKVTYQLPTYIVTNEGIVDGHGQQLYFCVGNKEDENITRYEGVFVESLIQLCVERLTSVNKGDLATRETALAITKLEEALLWLGKRAEDRKIRDVQGTYKK